jgi:hypothetical protein
MPDDNRPRNILEEIVWHKAREIEAWRDKTPLAALQASAAARARGAPAEGRRAGAAAAVAAEAEAEHGHGLGNTPCPLQPRSGRAPLTGPPSLAPL